MAKRTDIEHGLAAVMNHPEPGPVVFRMARGIIRATGKPMPCAFYIPTAEGIGRIKVTASDLEHPEKFQKLFDANPRRCAAVQVRVLPNNLVEGDQDAFLLGAGEADTFGGAFTIDQTRTLLRQAPTPIAWLPKENGRNTLRDARNDPHLLHRRTTRWNHRAAARVGSRRSQRDQF